MMDIKAVREQMRKASDEGNKVALLYWAGWMDGANDVPQNYGPCDLCAYSDPDIRGKPCYCCPAIKRETE